MEGGDFAQKDSKGEVAAEEQDKSPVKNSPCNRLYEGDPNLLIASWFDDIGYQQKEFDDKIVFYNSESLLNRESVLSHFSFSGDNKKFLQDKNI